MVPMNRFILEDTPYQCAIAHCDKHVVKMPVEEAQMLCTAHRMIDGTLEMRPSKSGKRMVKYWRLDDEVKESVLYRPVHMGHPCTVWIMQTKANYDWAYSLFVALCKEYQHRYGKVHMCEQKLLTMLSEAPQNIPDGPLTASPLAMGSNPECMDESDVIGSYRHYYATKKDRFKMTWSKREEPEWWTEYVQMVG